MAKPIMRSSDKLSIEPVSAEAAMERLPRWDSYGVLAVAMTVEHQLHWVSQLFATF